MEANLWLTHITRDAVNDVAKLTGTIPGRKRPPKSTIVPTGTSTSAGIPPAASTTTPEQNETLQSNFSGLSITDLLQFIHDPNIKTLNRYGSSLSRVGKTAPKRTFPGGASAVARNPKATSNGITAGASASASAITAAAATTTQPGVLNETGTPPAEQHPQQQQSKKRRKRKNKKGGQTAQ